MAGPRETEYRQQLSDLQDWEPFLMQESGLPGPRGNLELAWAAAALGTGAQFDAWIAADLHGDGNNPQDYLVFCGLVGLGELLYQGDRSGLATLRRYANDPRWRVREGVAMALQRWGDRSLDELLTEMRIWAAGSLFEQRAVVAALCEPRLLRDPAAAAATLALLDQITAGLVGAADRRDPGFQALRKGLGYGWSVAAVADLQRGKALMSKWIAYPDADVRWVMRENLRKNRLVKMDPEWVTQKRAEMGR
jgi:hypothetical protein